MSLFSLIFVVTIVAILENKEVLKSKSLKIAAPEQGAHLFTSIFPESSKVPRRHHSSVH